MCGIVGYVGSSQAAPILVEGLQKLEYRGYDSAGVAVLAGGNIEIVRVQGKLARLADALRARPLTGSTGIGHTRWATHGRPSEANAHPHSAGPVAIVHNGIIENHVALKRELQAEGVVFSSDTDTEIVAHLAHRELKRGAPSLFEAIRASLRRLTGAYAIAAVSKDEPNTIVVARFGSPLVLGKTTEAMFCGSDIPALLSHTREMIFLEDGDIAELKTGSLTIETVDGGKVERPTKTIHWNPVQAERGGYKHFMLKEIHEQPEVVAATLRGRVDLEAGDLNADEMGIDRATAASIGRVYLIACGTSHHAAIAGRYWIEEFAGVPSVVELASEVRYRKPVFTKDDLVIAISQSGETADTLAALKAAKAAGTKTLAITNVVDSAMARLAGSAMYTHAGPEIGVASTKCFTTQLAALLMLAVYLGRARGSLDATEGRRILQALWEIPGHMRHVLESEALVQQIARKLTNATDVLFLGRGVGFPIALEGALKLKEISYAHAEGYAAGEMKHGPIALIDEHLPVVVLCPQDNHYEKTLSNLQEVKARDGQIIAIGTEGDTELEQICAHFIPIPAVPEGVVHLLTVIPLQLLSYYVASLKGNDVDQPRNLAKTVTVE